MNGFCIFFGLVEILKLLVYQYPIVFLRCVALLIVWSVSAYAQPADQKLDSLHKLLEATSGKEHYDLLIEVSITLAEQNRTEDAIERATAALNLATNLRDSLLITEAGRLRGQLLRRSDKLNESIVQLLYVLPIAQRNGFRDEQKFILNALAAAYTLKANYDLALVYNFQSLTLREEEGNKREMSTTLNNIGLVYYKLGDYDQARMYYDRSLQAKHEVADTRGLDRLFINIALCHYQLGEYENAESYVKKGFDVCKEQCSTQIVVEGEFVLGCASFGSSDLKQAIIHFTRSYKLSKENTDIRWQAENALLLGRIELRRNNRDEALKYFQEVEALSSGAGYNQILITAYKELGMLYSQVNNFQSASEYQSKYIQLKDSVYGDELIKNLARAQTDYEQRENIKTIAEQDEILRLNQIVIDRQRQVYFFVALVAVLSIMITFVFLRYSRALTKAKIQLSQANQTLERRVEDRTKALQNVNNELDNFIYKTSHDIRGPLASLKGIANVALLELTDTKAQDYLHKLDASADKLNSILTRLLIVNQINHAVLTPVSIDFHELIQEILTFERKKGIPQRLTIRHEIDPEVKLITDRHILRIILENLIDNAIKYYNSSDRIEPFVRIKTAADHDVVKITVIDNGIGIKEHDPQKLFQMFVRASERSESGGIGLYLTKLASERLYAKVDFSTTPEKYTQFTVTLPADLTTIIVEKEKEVA